MCEAMNEMPTPPNQVVITCPIMERVSNEFEKKLDEISEHYKAINKEFGESRYNAGYQQALLDMSEAGISDKPEEHNEKPPRDDGKFSGCETLIRDRDMQVERANDFIEEVVDKMMDSCDNPGQIVVDRATMVKSICLLTTLIPRLLKPEEIREGDVIYCEYTGGRVEKWYVSTITEGKIYYAGLRGRSGYDRLEAYNVLWRAWTHCPTDSQRKAEQWRNEM